tara:strand:- start:169 stop:390 length:222 start_codon:yes stop_codon:yes gene_type:complete
MSVVIRFAGGEQVVTNKDHLMNQLASNYAGQHVSVVSKTASGLKHVDFVSVSRSGAVAGTYGKVDFTAIRFDL